MMNQTDEIMSTAESIQQSIRKKYHSQLFTKFAKAINKYELLRDGDRVAVCISGGKDSMLMALLFKELQQHKKISFEVVNLVMDPGYTSDNRRLIEKNAKKMGIDITIFDTDIFDSVYDVEDSPCYLCARMRRGHLYNKAKELGCNKIALGHHFDDVIETILMGMMYGGQFQTMMPKVHSSNFEGMELIRPMYLIKEEDIIHWKNYNELTFLACACRFTAEHTEVNRDGTVDSKRQEMKLLIKELRKVNPFVDNNIFKSAENVNLQTVVRYKENGVEHWFKEWYDDPKSYIYWKEQ